MASRSHLSRRLLLQMHQQPTTWQSSLLRLFTAAPAPCSQILRNPMLLQLLLLAPKLLLQQRLMAKLCRMLTYILQEGQQLVRRQAWMSTQQ